jgi:hypothetical protein
MTQAEPIQVSNLSQWSDEARQSFVRDSSGNSIYPFEPKPEQFDINAIAHGLSMQCRFNGHLDAFYSVAQHSVYVSRACRLRDAKMWGLMHDAAEVVFGDIPTPVKRYLPKEIDDLEEGLAQAICQRFNIPRAPGIDAEVKRADHLLLLSEAMTLHPDRRNGLRDWKGLKPTTCIDDYNLRNIDPLYYPWPPTLAKLQFLNEFYALERETPSFFLAYALG